MTPSVATPGDTNPSDATDPTRSPYRTDGLVLRAPAAWQVDIRRGRRVGKHPSKVLNIGGFNQRQGDTLPPQIFLTLKFVVCIALKIIDIVAY